MRNKHLVLMLFMVLLSPWATKAQTLTIHDGTVTNKYVPFYGYYADENQQNQMIYSATELTDMNGKAITQMVFYWGEGEIYVSENNVGIWTVSLGETTATTLSGLDLSTTLFQVFSGELSEPLQFDVTNHTLTITFTNPYQYNGGNLLVQFEHEASDDLDDYVFYGEEVNGASFSYGQTRDFLPKTTFSYSETACIMPSSATISNISSTGATFNWAGGSGTYNVQYKKSTDSQWTSRVANYNGFGVALTGLATNTAYQAQVQSVCGGNQVSGWKTVSFSTLAGIPLFEGFTSNMIPTAWEMHQGSLGTMMSGGAWESNDSYWRFGSATNGVFDEHARINVYGDGLQDWLITPNIPMESGIKLSFDLALTGYSGTLAAPETDGTDDRFVVLVTTDDCATWTILREWNNTGSSYVYNNIAHTANGQTEVIDLSSYSSGNIRIAFYAETTVGNADNNLHLDNVSIDYCAKPANFACTGTTNTMATFNWEGEANSWQIVLNDDFDHPYNTSSNPPYTISGLTAGTIYIAKIRAYADYQHYSQWTRPVSFMTSFCAAEDQCQISYTLGDSGNDGWDDAVINVIDVASDITIAVITLEDGSSLNDTLTVCNGRELLFEWEYGNYDYECSYVFRDINGEVIFQGSDEMEEDIEYTVDCAVTDCRKPTDLIVVDYASTYVTLMWEPGATDQNLWEIMLNEDETHLITTNSNPFTVTGLSPETEYTVRVRANCGEKQSHWSNEIDFETDEFCPEPVITDITDIMPTSAALEWYGESDSYEVSYRIAAHIDPLFTQDFENGFGDWTRVYTANTPDINSNAARTGSYGFYFSSFSSASSYDQYLVSPQLNTTGTLSFYYKNSSANGDETFKVGYSSTSNQVASFTWGEEVVASSCDWEEYTEVIPNGTNYIAIWYYSNYQYYLYVDDIVIGNPIAAGGWQTITTTDNSTNLNGLNPITTYEVKVQGFCEGNITTVESYIQTFTTLEKAFCVNGNWNVANNWSPVGIPTATENVVIMADAIIPANCDALANSITIGEGKSLTIKDGGQLHSNTNVYATVEKNITGYTSTKDHYYLISPPFRKSFNTSAVENLLTGTFDFYSFDGMQEGQEWRNHQASPINSMTFGKGYLYANDEDVTLRFSGITYAQTNNLGYANGGSSHPLTFDESKIFGKFNLVGNMFPHNGYVYLGSFSGSSLILTSTYYYKMNDTGSELMVSNEMVKPCEGIFVQTTAANQYAFVSSVKRDGYVLGLRMNLTQGDKLLDAVVLDFTRGEGLEKIQLNPNHTKLYIPKDNKDFAVVSVDASDEVPVSFKAERNGTYTISVNPENVEFDYLHLIDTMTGADVDLLVEPIYTFDAKTTDYSSRFRLVFSANDVLIGSASDENFAFINDGDIIITDDIENATLQVTDVTGRVVSTVELSHHGRRITTMGMAPGEYVLRLINGDDVKTQKMIID